MPSEPAAEDRRNATACRRAHTGRSAAACGDPGLRMFHEHLGRWFAPEPEPALPARTTCPLCGARDVPLHAAAEAKCAARLAISAKRPGRRSAAEPADPAPAGSRGMVSFGAGSLAIAGPRVARAITRLLPVRPLPAHVELRYPEPGRIRQALADLLRDPPPPPFTVILFGQKAGFRARVTTDPSLIHLNGPEPATLGRARLRRLPSPGSPTLTALHRLLLL